MPIGIFHLLAGASVIAAVAPSVTYAQETQSPDAVSAATSDDIVVTARRISESASKVPVSITAFSGEQLVTRGVRSLEDVVKIAPGINVSMVSSKITPFVTIRGQTRSSTGNAAPGVLIYFNEVPLAMSGSMLPTFDMDNIQVLKGPQGTLFGRNALGGALLAYSKKPTHEFGGYVEVKGGTYDFKQVEGAINVPIMQDKVALRLAGQVYHDRASYGKTIYVTPFTVSNPGNGTVGVASPGVVRGGNWNGDEYRAVSLRASLLIEPVPGISNVTVVDYTKVRGNMGGSLGQFLPNGLVGEYNTVAPAIIFNPPSALGQVATNINRLFNCGTSALCDWRLFQAQVATEGWNTIYTNADYSQAYISPKGVSNTTTIDLGSNLTFKNIFAWRKSVNHSVTDLDGSPFVILATFGVNALKVVTDEVQLSGSALNDKLKFTAGGLYYKSSSGGDGGYSTVVSYTFFGLSNAVSTTYLTDISKAAFAQADYSLDSILPGLSLTAGYRHTWDESSACAASIGFGSQATQLGWTPNAPLIGGATPNVPTEAQCIAQANGVAGSIPASDYPGSTSISAQNFNKTKFNKGTYTLGAKWQITDDAMVYVAKRRGYRAGGFNTPKFDNFLSGVQNFQPEVLDDWEVGAKLRWRGAIPGSLDLAVYRGVDNNAQLALSTSGFSAGVCVPAAIGDTTATACTTAGGIAGRTVRHVANSTIVNAGKRVFQGFELAGRIEPIEGISIGGSVAYVDDTTKSFALDPNLDAFLAAAGRTLVRVFPPENQPKWQYNINLGVEFPTPILGGKLSANADFRHSDKFYTTALYSVPGFNTVDAGVRLSNIGGTGVTAALTVTNVTNEQYLTGPMSAATVGVTAFNHSTPRRAFLSLRYDFGSL